MSLLLSEEPLNTQKFPRASRDNCLRSPDVLQGPFRREVRYIPGRIRRALVWAGAVALYLSMFYMPEVFSWLAR